MLNLNETEIYKDYLGKFLFILSLFILGLMIYLIIQKPFLHIDEWYTKGLITVSFNELAHICASVDMHPPFYYLTVWIPANILNLLHIPFDEIFVMKMMSVLSYIILYIISFTKIRKDYGWLAGGLFAFTLLTMGDFFTIFSIGRMYQLGILLLVCGFISAGEILKNPKLKDWILLTIFAVLGAYTQYFIAISFVVLYGLLLLYILVKNKSELKNWFSSVVFGILCYIPWAFILFKQMTKVQGGALNIKETTFNSILEFFSSVFTTSSPEISIQLIGSIIFLAIFVLVLKEYKKSPKENEFVLLGLLIFVGIILCGVVSSVVFKPILLARYLTPALGVVWLSISIFISRCDFKKVIIPVVIVLLLFSAVNLYGQIDEISKNHEKLIENQKFLDSINNNNSVVIITSNVKYVHFYNELDKAIIYEDFTIDERKWARDLAKIYDDKDVKFLIPNDVDKYNNKNIYIANRDGNDLKLPSGYSLKPVGKIENCQFSKLVHSNN